MPVSLKAPSSVRAELRRGLKWHEEGHSGDGLKPETVAWARKLADGAEITRDKAVKMSAWLARHAADKSGKGFSPGEGYPSPGRVAWALWGGDPAIGWSAKLVRFFEGKNMEKRNYNAEQRRMMADKGEAMEDGSFPIADKTDLMAAMRSIGRAKDPAGAKRHIRARAKALGLEDMLGPAFKKAANIAIKKGYTARYCYASPSLELPVPCAPSDLTPGMQAGYPGDMQIEFCAAFNALAKPIPEGAGFPSEQAYFMAMDRLRQRGWCEAPGEQWYRVEAMGLPADYETMDSTESSEEVQVETVEAQKGLAAFLETLRLTAEERSTIAKAGRMISAKNHKTLTTGHKMIMDGAEMIKGVLPVAAETEPDEEVARKAAERAGYITDMESLDKSRGTLSPRDHGADWDQRNGIAQEADNVTLYVPIEKANTIAKKKQVFGYAYVAKNDGKQVVDHSGDIVEPEAMEKAIYSSFGKLLSRENHKTDAKAHVIESLWMTHDKLQKMGIPTKGQPDGAWWVGMQVTDDALWKKIEDGTYKMFSIGGSGKRVPIA